MSLFQRLFGKRPAPPPAGSEVGSDDWQVNAAKEICIAMLRQIPEEWDSAALVLTTPEHGFGTGLTHSAIAPTPSAGGALRDARFVLPNMEVMNATRALELGWVARHLEPFRRATFITWRDGENWEVRADYEYDD